MSSDLHLGYRPDALATSPYARFFRPEMAALAEPVRQAILRGPVAHELMPPVSGTPDLQSPGYWAVENGFSLCPDGSARINVLTPMPGVTPAMWDWWFAWHGSEAERYKLWHPKAHVHVAWADGRSDLTHYVGRTSKVVEYVGSRRLDLTIRFVPPTQLGLDEAGLAARGEVAICARGGMAGTPFETGWLVHHIRPVPGGSEMRSRFWLAGDNVRPRGMESPVGALIGRTLGKLAQVPTSEASNLLVHCAEEMAHLAAILPEIHKNFGPEAST